MSRVSGFLSGSSPILKRYQTSVSVATAGIPMTGSVTTGTGLVKATTTNLVGYVGMAADTAVYSTTQLGNATGGGGGNNAGGAAGGGAATAAAYVGVIINPDVMITSRLCGSATSGTALVAYANTSASSGGLVHTAAVGTNTMVNGTVWELTGANAGQSRIITSWSSNTSLTNIVPFDYAIAVGDTFARVPLQPFGGINTCTTMQFTSDLTEVDSTIAVGTGAIAVVIELFLRDAAGNGVNDSWVVWSPSGNTMLYVHAGGS